MSLEAFISPTNDASILRVYTLMQAYQFCRQLEKAKQISSNLYSHCIIIRHSAVANKTDFGYKQQLKTNILKKMHFVYLNKIEDLIAFFYAQIKASKKYLTNQEAIGIKTLNIKSENLSQQKIEPLIGMILVQNIQDYFGGVFAYEEMGQKFFVFTKLLKTLSQLLPGKAMFTFAYSQKNIKLEKFQTYLRSEEITYWKIGRQMLNKNGYSYQSQQTRKFYQIYGTEQQNMNNKRVE